jgi:hypothetical protein
VSSSQIALHIICALATGVMYFLWRRLKEDHKRRVWRLYGWYTGLACIGSAFGATTAFIGVIYEQYVVQLTQARNSAEQIARELQVSFWVSTMVVPDALEIFFISIALLIVLDRLVHVAFATSSGLSARLVLSERVIAGLVVGLNVLSVCFSAAASYYFHRCIPPLEHAAAAMSANDHTSSKAHMQEFRKMKSLSNNVYAVQMFTESAALIFVVSTFSVVFIVCSRRIRGINRRAIAESSLRQQAKLSQEASELQTLETTEVSDGHAGESSFTSDNKRKISIHTAGLVDNMKAVHRQIFFTVAVVFLSLLCMAICLTFYGTVTLSDSRYASSDGDISLCDPKATTNSLIGNWMTLNPHFFILTVYMPGPIAMLVALWGMTSDLMLKIIKTNGQRGSTGEGTERL